MKKVNILIKLIFVFTLGITMVISCDVVDLEENPKSFIAPEGFFNTPAQIE